MPVPEEDPIDEINWNEAFRRRLLPVPLADVYRRFILWPELTNSLDSSLSNEEWSKKLLEKMEDAEGQLDQKIDDYIITARPTVAYYSSAASEISVKVTHGAQDLRFVVEWFAFRVEDGEPIFFISYNLAEVAPHAENRWQTLPELSNFGCQLAPGILRKSGIIRGDAFESGPAACFSLYHVNDVEKFLAILKQKKLISDRAPSTLFEVCQDYYKEISDKLLLILSSCKDSSTLMSTIEALFKAPVEAQDALYDIIKDQLSSSCLSNDEFVRIFGAIPSRKRSDFISRINAEGRKLIITLLDFEKLLKSGVSFNECVSLCQQLNISLADLCTRYEDMQRLAKYLEKNDWARLIDLISHKLIALVTTTIHARDLFFFLNSIGRNQSLYYAQLKEHLLPLVDTFEDISNILMNLTPDLCADFCRSLEEKFEGIFELRNLFIYLMRHLNETLQVVIQSFVSVSIYDAISLDELVLLCKHTSPNYSELILRTINTRLQQLLTTPADVQKLVTVCPTRACGLLVQALENRWHLIVPEDGTFLSEGNYKDNLPVIFDYLKEKIHSAYDLAQVLQVLSPLQVRVMFRSVPELFKQFIFNPRDCAEVMQPLTFEQRKSIRDYITVVYTFDGELYNHPMAICGRHVYPCTFEELIQVKLHPLWNDQLVGQTISAEGIHLLLSELLIKYKWAVAELGEFSPSKLDSLEEACSKKRFSQKDSEHAYYLEALLSQLTDDIRPAKLQYITCILDFIVTDLKSGILLNLLAPAMNLIHRKIQSVKYVKPDPTPLTLEEVKLFIIMRITIRIDQLHRENKNIGAVSGVTAKKIKVLLEIHKKIEEASDLSQVSGLLSKEAKKGSRTGEMLLHLEELVSTIHQKEPREEAAAGSPLCKY
ncbi:Uncharacterised protein (plasmid) [Legionella adelaidensis]|uniref:Uncharacterized protein n=1 Tax=Legionella adelaidensis TaxID=45056 RepID=A0A0W0R407_9GAMM|nr:hypothetical protein [Legionella adelaidensis]KTC65812.1 hypothetical protein Lade_0470 [Legionella adelaidensis]VEH85240.1 Uncharacterised protein [Legionella adelaidensis]